MEQLLWTVGEAMEATRIGRTKMYQLLSSGEIPAVRVGGAVRIPVAALREWVHRKADLPKETAAR